MKLKKYNNTEKLVFDLVKPIADENGSDVWDVRFEKEGASWYLRVFIDKEDGVSIDDCEAVSRPLSDILDEKDPIQQGYYLEVGSAGMGRELVRASHFESAVGDVIFIKLYSPLNGIKQFKARLTGFDTEKLTIENPFKEEEDVRTMTLDKIASVKLADEFDKEL